MPSLTLHFQGLSGLHCSMKGFINLFTSFIFAEVYRFAAYRIGIPQSLVQQVHFDDSILSISRDFFTKFDISSKKV